MKEADSRVLQVQKATAAKVAQAEQEAAKKV